MKDNGFKLAKEKSRRYPTQTITDADYADDLALLANTPTQAETLLHSLERASAGIGLHFSADKTEYMSCNQTGDISTLNGSSLNSSVLIQDVALQTSQQQWTIETSGERWSGRSMLAVRHDDDDCFQKINKFLILIIYSYIVHLFNINEFLNKCIWPINGILTGTTSSGPSSLKSGRKFLRKFPFRKIIVYFLCKYTNPLIY